MGERVCAGYEVDAGWMTMVQCSNGKEQPWLEQNTHSGSQSILTFSHLNRLELWFQSVLIFNYPVTLIFSLTADLVGKIWWVGLEGFLCCVCADKEFLFPTSLFSRTEHAQDGLFLCLHLPSSTLTSLTLYCSRKCLEF